MSIPLSSRLLFRLDAQDRCLGNAFQHRAIVTGQNPILTLCTFLNQFDTLPYPQAYNQS